MCDGDWEHQNGIKITTLDNPGWRVEINLEDTLVEETAFTEVKWDTSELDWGRCWVNGGIYNGAGGPEMLTRLLAVFRQWVESHAYDASNSS